MIGSDGEQIGIVPLSKALELAERAGLDLVEIAPQAKPPVCKILDYGKYKYEQKQKAKEAKKKATTIQVKEIKLRPKTDRHDIETKIRHIKRFLLHGDKAKITVNFRGREITHTDRGKEILDFIYNTLSEELAQELGDDDGRKLHRELGPKMEGRNMVMILTLAKKSSKKGGSKK